MRKSLAILFLSLVALASSASDASAQRRSGLYGGRAFSGAYTPWNTLNSGYYANNYSYRNFNNFSNFGGYTLPSYGYSTNYNYYQSFAPMGSFQRTYNHPTFRNAGYPQFGWRGW